MGTYFFFQRLSGDFNGIRGGLCRIMHVIGKASIFKRLEENSCILSAINLEKIKDFINVKIDEIVFAGSGSKGALLCQILADVTAYKITVPKVTEATALGAAMAAGVGAGIYDSIVKASEDLVVWNKEYLPYSENFSKYSDIKKQWQEVYENQLSLVDRGLTQSMWKAPGV